MAGLSPLPVTARLEWQMTALATSPQLRPMLATVPREGGRRLEGYAALSCRDDDDGLRIGIPRPGSDDAWDIAASTPQIRRVVAGRLAGMIAAAEPPWRLEITGIQDRRTADLLARLLPGAQVDRVAGVPIVQLRLPGGGAGFEVPERVRKTLSRGASHLDADGVIEDPQWTRDPKTLLAMMPEIQAAHEDRDAEEPERESDLAADGALGFWQATYQLHALRGELEVGTLGIDGHLAAYVVAILDRASNPPAYRVLDGRIARAWKRYYPGIRLEAAMLGRVLADGRWDYVDWMSRRFPQALLMANGTTPDTWELRAAAVSAAAGPALAALPAPAPVPAPVPASGRAAVHRGTRVHGGLAGRRAPARCPGGGS